MTNFPIDFVVTWVDTTDPLWQADFEKYSDKLRYDDSCRYRNWDLFHYWFRSVEKYAPWVNKVFLVTNGKTPDWLNKKCPKLVCVSHSEFIPKEYLPTFNSNCIELNLGRIDGLSEHFVYFNDDCYLNYFVKPSYYFKHGLPCDYNYEKFVASSRYDPVNKLEIKLMNFCNIVVLNKHFDRRLTVIQSPWRWFGFHLGGHFFQSLVLFGSSLFNCFSTRHIEQPFLKHIFSEIWEKEPDFMDGSCTRFREHTNLTPYFIRYWQFASNNFYPIRRMFRRMKWLQISPNLMNKIEKALFSHSVRSLCINDTPECTDDFFDEAQSRLKTWFDRKLPEKSSFEL